MPRGYEIKFVRSYLNFFRNCFLKVFDFYSLIYLFALGPIEYKIFLNKSIWPIDGIPKGRNTSGLCGLRCNRKEGVGSFPLTSRTDTV